MADIKSKVTIDATDAVQTIEKLNELLFKSIGATKEEFTEFERRHKEKTAMRKGGLEYHKEEEAALDISKRKYKQYASEVSMSYEQMLKDMKKDGGLPAVLAAGMPEHLVGAQQAVSSAKSAILKELPFGGLMGLMFLGTSREEEVRTMGAGIVRQFQQAGETGRREFKEVGNIAYDLGVKLGKGPGGMQAELAATASAFAKAGIDVEDVMNKKFKYSIDGTTGSLLESSNALDALFKLPAGTAGTTAAKMVREFGMGLGESQEVIAAIGMTARESGSSFDAFMQSVMRSATALRAFRADATDLVKEVAMVQAKITETLKGQGMSPQFAAEYAERVTGQITQAFAGMGPGLSAVLGEMITSGPGGIKGAGGKAVSGLDAAYMMKGGLSGEIGGGQDRQIFTQGLEQLTKLVREQAGPGMSEQRRMFESLLKLPFGSEGAKVLAEMGGEISKGVDINKVLESRQDDLRKAFTNSAQEANALMRDLQKIQKGIADIGMGILGAIINGFKLVASYAEKFMARSGSREEFVAQQNITATMGLIQKNWDKIAEGATGVGSGAMGAFKTMVAPAGSYSKEAIEAEATKKFGPDIFRDREVTSDAPLGVRLGSMMGFKPKEVDPTKVRESFRSETARQLESEMGGAGFGEKDISRLISIYKQEEKASGRGEEAFSKAVSKMKTLPSGVSREEAAGMASRTETAVATGMVPGSPLQFKVFVQVSEGKFSGKAEGG